MTRRKKMLCELKQPRKITKHHSFILFGELTRRLCASAVKILHYTNHLKTRQRDVYATH